MLECGARMQDKQRLTEWVALRESIHENSPLMTTISFGPSRLSTVFKAPVAEMLCPSSCSALEMTTIILKLDNKPTKARYFNKMRCFSKNVIDSRVNLSLVYFDFDLFMKIYWYKRKRRWLFVHILLIVLRKKLKKSLVCSNGRFLSRIVGIPLMPSIRNFI